MYTPHNSCVFYSNVTTNITYKIRGKKNCDGKINNNAKYLMFRIHFDRKTICNSILQVLDLTMPVQIILPRPEQQDFTHHSVFFSYPTHNTEEVTIQNIS